MSTVLDLARPDLLDLQAYSHAAWEPTLERLHANELPWRSLGDNSIAGLNRYPEPQPQVLIDRLAEVYGVTPDRLLIGRGSDEAIDLLVRGFCRAERESVLICPPTFGMYKVAARIQGAGVVEVPLLREREFSLDEDAIMVAMRKSEPASRVKIVFLCSPNNPTGNLIAPGIVERLCDSLRDRALVVVDEAYIEFAAVDSFVTRIGRFPNLVVLRTLSKAYALAGARCGGLIGDPALVEFLRRLIPPYALPSPTIQAALDALQAPQRATGSARIQVIKEERERVTAALREIGAIQKVWPSETNFVLVDCLDAGRCLEAIRATGLLVRDVRKQAGLERSLRITIGTPEQNDRLLRALERI